MNIEQLMEQAQVFASAWALVGGRFDNGDMLETATIEKAELRVAINELIAERDAHRKALEQALEALKANTTYTEDGRPVYPNDLENHNIITAIQEQLK